MAWRPLTFLVVASLVAFLPPTPAAATEATCTDTNPPNDCRENATLLTARNVRLTQSNVHAGVEPGEPLGPDMANTVWWTFVAEGPLTGSFSVANSDHQAGVSIYELQTDGTLLLLDHASGWSGNPWTSFTCVAGRTYYVQAGGEEGSTGIIDLHGSACRPGLPAAAALVAAPGSTRGSISLSWTPGSNGGATVTSWTVERASPTCAGFTSLASLPGSATSHTDTGRTEGTVYCYRVQATNAAGPGSWSNSAPTAPLGIPPPVSGLVARAGQGQIALDWDPPAHTGGASVTYRVLASDAPNGWYETVHTGTTDSFTHTGLAAGVWRFYRVTAENAYGPSAVTTASARVWAPPSVPRNVDAEWAIPYGVRIDWDPPADNGGLPITSYQLYRAPKGEPLELRASVPASQTSFVDTPPALRPYDYAVLAVNDAGPGPLSWRVCGESVPIPPGLPHC